MKRIYLDNAATTQIHPEVLRAMVAWMEAQYGNPSSVHGFGREAWVAIEKARRFVAAHLHVKPTTIVFTSAGAI